MKRIVVGLTVFAIALSLTPRQTLASPFSYQGQLSKNSVLVNGTCDLQFSLYSALNGGTPFNPVPLTQPNVAVANGVFTVLLDFGPGAFDGTARWLSISVQGSGDPGYSLLTPRQTIAAAPYASYAFGGNTGFTLPYLQAVNSPSQAAFQVDNTATTGFGHGIVARSYSTTQNAAGVVGEGSATSGFTTGVHGTATFSPQGTGVVGRGNAMGVYGEGSPGLGVKGVSENDVGVRGLSTIAQGVLGSSTNGTGVEGQSTNFHGVFGATGNVNSAGVYGSSIAGDGVFGYCTAANKAAIVGLANQVQARAGYFRNDGGGAGIYSEVTSATSIQGNATSGLGVYGVSVSNDGVFGQSGGAGKSGIVGVSYNASGQGGYFVNQAGGAALYVVGLAKTGTLQILGGSDLAEPFDISASSKKDPVAPGMVVVIDPNHPGRLRISESANDTRVAGIVSGAKGLAPGMVMRAEGVEHADGAFPVALTGRVWCWADASFGPIEPGSLLTTSSTPGHAMAATGSLRVPGATLGKAMTGLTEGRGLVLVLVSLQ